MATKEFKKFAEEVAIIFAKHMNTEINTERTLECVSNKNEIYYYFMNEYHINVRYKKDKKYSYRVMGFPPKPSNLPPILYIFIVSGNSKNEFIKELNREIKNLYY